MNNTLVLPIVIIFVGALPGLLSLLLARRMQISMVILGWVSSIFPASAFLILFYVTLGLPDHQPIIASIPWIPSLDMQISIYFDHLSALFSLLITGIGTLVVIYTGYYFKSDHDAGRFFTYIFLFMGFMLGIVLAGDLYTLFIFWEGTSITSYLLVAYKYKDESARKGAFRALFITGGGGIAMLAGFIFVDVLAGTTQYDQLFAQVDILRNSVFYTAPLLLIAFGAITKSAQFPAHIWLPGAMSAPTPASAFLHSATMVNAGIYLMARLHPVLGKTEAWFWLLTLVGLATMLVGAYLGFKQNDLKALLAYSTISQLGILMMLIGQDTEIAFKAFVIGLLAHTLYKSSLFLSVGIIDHETGTRELNRLGGLWRQMPLTFIFTTIAALSMAGLPPLFGFLAKETLLATATHPSVPAGISALLPALSLFAGAFLLAQSLLLIYETFLGKSKTGIKSHDPGYLMLLAPAIPATLSLVFGVLPEPKRVAEFLALAAADIFGSPVKVSLALWNGINVPLALSAIAIGVGGIVFYYRDEVRNFQQGFGERYSWDRVYASLLAGIDRAAHAATRLQFGKLRVYLASIMAGMLALVIFFSLMISTGAKGSFLSLLTSPFNFDFEPGILNFLQIFTLLLAFTAALASILLRRDIHAIIASGVMGLSISILFVLEPAPDVALVQIVVDILAVVILVLALARIPRSQRLKASRFTFLQSQRGLVRDLVVSIAGGILVALLTFGVLITRPRTSQLTPFYEAVAKPLTDAKDIVGAIIVDFRAMDTLIEILVFSLAGIGIYTLLRFAARTHNDKGDQVVETPYEQDPRIRTFGVGGPVTSSLVHALAYVSFPIALTIAMIHIIFGHDQPGDGFTAGVIFSLAIGFWYIVFGYYETRKRLSWLKPGLLVGGGVLLVVISATSAYILTGDFLAPINFGEMLGLRLPEGVYLSGALLFEISIFMAVTGSVTYMLNSLGHPGENSVDEEIETAHISNKNTRPADQAEIPAEIRPQ